MQRRRVVAGRGRSEALGLMPCDGWRVARGAGVVYSRGVACRGRCLALVVGCVILGS